MAKRENSPVIFPAPTKATDFFDFQGDTTIVFKHFEKMFFGVELECTIARRLYERYIDTGEDTRQQVVEAIYPKIENVGILKFEAVPYGFEIASAPGTFEWHQTAWNDFFELIENNPALLEKRGRACGMHVHLPKDAFKDKFHYGRMGFFIHREENRDFIQKIGGREHYFVKFSVPSKFEGAKNAARTAFHPNTQYGTVEARFFASTLVREEFLKNLEFVHCLIRFCRASCGKEHKEKMTAENFNAFLSEGTRKNRYPNLWNFLNPDSKIGYNEQDTDAPEADKTPAMVKRSGPIGEFTDAPAGV